MRYLDTSDVAPTLRPISVIGLGTWQFGSGEVWGYGEGYDRRSAALVNRALDLGMTLVDTAEIYGQGRSERLVGAALGDRRDQVVLATKIFPLLPVAPVVEQRAVASAHRLGVQRIDLYQVHQANPLVPDTRTMPGMRALQDVGLVDQVGVSNYSLDRWRVAERALGRPVLSNQVQYSLAHRGPEDDLLPYAAQAGRVVIAYSPLGQGLLSGRYSAQNPPPGKVRRINPLFLPVNLERAEPLLARLREVADAHQVTMAQVALAYLVHHPGVVAIPGASTEAQVESNAVAGDLLLADDEVAALSAAAKAFRPVRMREAVVPLLRSLRRAD